MEPQRDFSALRVLVVDDQEPVRRWLLNVLRTLGVTNVVEADGGRAAASIVNTPGETFDLILCDLRMPDWDGVETLRALAASRIQSAVVIVSGEDERLIDTTALLAGAHGLRLLGTVQKPVSVQNLQPLLSRVRARTTPTRPQAAIAQAPIEDIVAAFELRQLFMAYQPKVSVRTGEVVGVEALVRWDHPVHGLFPPSAFVPLVDATPDLSAQLATFTLGEVVQCVGRARAAGRVLNAAINLSRRGFDRLDLPEHLEALCIRNGVEPSQITLELTETAVAHDAVRLLDVATRLRLKGFSLSIDDFGTGESGLSQLKRLPFTELKIDREFVDGCSRSATQRSVVEASIALARNLKMFAVAEGVQYRADWDVLAELECDAVQGYFVAMPMTEAQLADWSYTGIH
jgi:EAL domain-containing protein (putative c-di-GMP-specific phosphodiesterase class I)/CheY-like chemotaxis protein